MLLKAQGDYCNRIAMKNRKQCVDSDLNVEEVETINNIKIAKKKLKELVKKGQEIRDRELMEMNPNEINEDSEVNRKSRKEAMRKINKEK